MPLLPAFAFADRAAHSVSAHTTRSDCDREVVGPANLPGLQVDFLEVALGMPHLCSYLITARRDHARQFPDDVRDGDTPAFTPAHALVTDAIKNGVLKDRPQSTPACSSIARTANLRQGDQAGSTPDHQY